MRSFSIAPTSTPLKGQVIVPGDKSITHRALILECIGRWGLVELLDIAKGRIV